MIYIYPNSSLSIDKIEEAKDKGIITSYKISEEDYIIDTNSGLKELEKAISPSKGYNTYKIEAEIDCSHCAMKVEEGLKSDKYINEVSFNFQKKLLTVTTLYSKETIMEMASNIEEDISFPQEKKWEKRVYSVKIDCEECALEVEEALNNDKDFKEVIFNFPKGKLSLTTHLCDKEVMERTKRIEEDLEFLDLKDNNFVFTLTLPPSIKKDDFIKTINKDERIKKCWFDKSNKLHVTTTLGEKEVITLSSFLFPSISFHTVSIEEKRSYTLEKVIVAIVILSVSHFFSLPLLALVAYIVSGYDVLWKALKNIIKGKIFDENFLMAIATIAALFTNNLPEAAFVMIFYQIGEYFQDKATDKSRDSIGKLLDLSVENVEAEKDGSWVVVEPEEVKKGSKIRVKGGERFALDSIVYEGEGYIDTRAITGESVPVKVKKGDKILSGSVNGEATLVLITQSEYQDSTATKIMKLVEEGEGKKAESEKFISVFSRYYTPAVCISALLLALISPLFGVTWKDSIYRAAMLLVISCPCALVLSVPLTYFASMGAFAKNGILVKGDDAIQKLTKVKTVAFDKTGTLTFGVFSVQDILFLSTTKEHLATVTKSIESQSTHPVASALLSLEEGEVKEARNVQVLKGIGMEGYVDGKRILVGNNKISPSLPDVNEEGTLVYVLEDSNLLGVYVISDKVRDEAKDTISKIKEYGIERTVILSGDRKTRVENTGSMLNIDQVYGELLPQDKLNLMEKLKQKGVLMYVGDGINDAPTLATADVAVAMGGVGSDSAIEASDCVIMNDDISKLIDAFRIAKKTDVIVKENIVFSLLVKAIVFILALMGCANMWLAVFADTGVSLIAVANSLRALLYKKKR